MSESAGTPLLAEDHAAFIQGAVSIVIASRDGRNVPSISRATGCAVAAGRRSVSVFLARTQATQVLADVASCRRVAVVYTRPSTNRSLQIKGEDARIRDVTAEEQRCVARYIEQFGLEISPLGFRPEQADTLYRCVEGDLVAVEFTPTAAFEQTPGPGAGAAIRLPA